MDDEIGNEEREPSVKDLEDPHWAKKSHGDGKYRGLSDHEWASRRQDQQHHLEELVRKEKELEKANAEVKDGLSHLQSDKKKINADIE